MTEPARTDDLVVVGKIRRSHGVDGVVVIEPLTADADAVFTEGRQLLAGDIRGNAVRPPRALRIEMAAPFQGGFRVQFDAITDRNEADRWRNRYVLAPRAELPEPGPDEIYLHDLIGLDVIDAAGAGVGTVEAYYELPHDVMIEVARPGAESVMVPYRFVVDVDLDARRLVVDPPVGLL
jgi:16S rRNA processing protein RimM